MLVTASKAGMTDIGARQSLTRLAKRQPDRLRPHHAGSPVNEHQHPARSALRSRD